MTLHDCDGRIVSVSEMFQVISGGVPDDVAASHFPEEAVAEMWHAAEALATRFPSDNIDFVRHPGANPYAGNPDDDIIDPLFADDDAAKLDGDHDGNRRPLELPF